MTIDGHQGDGSLPFVMSFVNVFIHRGMVQGSMGVIEENLTNQNKDSPFEGKSRKSRHVSLNLEVSVFQTN